MILLDDICHLTISVATLPCSQCLVENQVESNTEGLAGIEFLQKVTGLHLLAT